MNCDATLPVLQDYVDRELDPQDRERVAAHLQECPGCAARANSLRELKQVLQRRFLPGPAPAQLGSQIMAQLHTATTGDRARRRVARVAAALFLVAAVGISGSLLFGKGPGYITQVVDTFEAAADTPLALQTHSRPEAEQWLRRKLAREVSIPAFCRRLTLEGCETATLRGQQVALVRYRDGTGKSVVLFIVPGKAMPPLSGTKPHTKRGCGVLCWRVGQQFYSMVASHLSPAQLDRFRI